MVHLLQINILLAGFGLGALNDADDDDVDIYDNQIRSNNRRLAFEAGDDEDDRNVSTSSRHSTKQASLQSGGFFKNGAPLLSGFVITHAAVLEQKRYSHSFFFIIRKLNNPGLRHLLYRRDGSLIQPAFGILKGMRRPRTRTK